TTRNAANIPPQPIRSEPAIQVMALAAHPIVSPPLTKENASLVSPWRTAPVEVATAAQTKPDTSSPADHLVAQAHAWSNTAKTEQDYSRIIETCRRAQASQASPATAT